MILLSPSQAELHCPDSYTYHSQSKFTENSLHYFYYDYYYIYYYYDYLLHCVFMELWKVNGIQEFTVSSSHSSHSISEYFEICYHRRAQQQQLLQMSVVVAVPHPLESGAKVRVNSRDLHHFSLIGSGEINLLYYATHTHKCARHACTPREMHFLVSGHTL